MAVRCRTGTVANAETGKAPDQRRITSLALVLRRVRGTGYHFFDGQGAPQGAQAPAKSSGDTARPLDGLTR